MAKPIVMRVALQVVDIDIRRDTILLTIICKITKEGKLVSCLFARWRIVHESALSEGFKREITPRERQGSLNGG